MDARARFIALVFDALSECDQKRADAGSIADVHAALLEFNEAVKAAALEPKPAPKPKIEFGFLKSDNRPVPWAEGPGKPGPLD